MLGRRKLSGSRTLMNIVSWIVLTENQSCSSGHFPRTHNTAVTSGNPKESGVEDYQSVSNSPDFEYISKPWETPRTKFEFGSHQCRKTCSERFE